MIYSLLHAPDSGNDRPGKSGGYRCELYRRERVLAVAQSPEGQAAQRRWNATLRGSTPNPGWTPRLGNIGRHLSITAVAAGRILDLMGYRSDGCVTNSAMAAGFGVPRWNDFTMQNDWYLDRVLAAIRTAVQDTENPVIANALTAVIAKQQYRVRAEDRKHRRDEMEAAQRGEQESVITGLQAELVALRSSDPGISLLDGVEYITAHPGHRLLLYRRASADGSNTSPDGTGRSGSGVANDLALLERRAMAEGFQIMQQGLDHLGTQRLRTDFGRPRLALDRNRETHRRIETGRTSGYGTSGQ
jgi:hypothetical protein